MKKLLIVMIAIATIATIKNIESQITHRESIIDEQLRVIKQQNIDMDKLIEELEYIKNELQKWEIIDLEVTAYSPRDNISGICTDGNPEITASGTSPKVGTVAVNPKIIPYGTRLIIPGYGLSTAEDTGAAIRARINLIDIYMDSHQEAIKWGRQNLKVLVERND
ncbi:hypothetical protein HYG86_09245 [Alkalicella caledoniensis]|uniref:3D domain-containing protein n=1 Tax=Alkalicella caledoniensis TaxID=2731377 RepID=A0A7G9W8D4_ALKCA|nr:3D domain-containing protein [Alkalicella caledoniensis]QNO14946.1 hypothetical protein HYG86_09245 [Alkalicella caledoniensis]